MISVVDETYDRLKRRKGEKSFSKLFDELLDEKNRRVLRFAGILKNSNWKNVDSAKWVSALRKEGGHAHQKRAKRLEKHWKE